MGSSRSWSLSPLIAVLVLSITSVPADARRPPGALDRSFGAGGKVVTDVFGGGDEPSDIAVQSDGKLLVSTLSQRSGGDPRALVLRYDADGRLDPSFGDGGRAAVEVPGAEPRVTQPAVRPVALEVQADGRIVVVSDAFVSGGTKTAVTRLSPSGSPDATYGDGGTRVTTLGTDNEPMDLALQPDGKVLVVANVRFEGDANPNMRPGLLRFEPDGDPDPTFDGDGRAIAPPAGSELPTALAVRADGRILVASSLNRFYISLLRFLPDGRPDSAFGEGGRLVRGYGGEYPSISDLALRPNGASVGLGENEAPFLTAFTPEGELDGSFGSGGVVPSGAVGRGRAAALDARGAAVVVGTHFAVARYTRRGRLDRGFGQGGLVQTDFGPRDDESVEVALQTDGKIVVLGLDRPLSLPDKPSDIEIARYWGGYDRGKPRIRIRGVPRRRCLRRRTRVRIRISDLSALSRVHVRLDGRRVRATRKRRFSIRLRPSRLRPGRHRLSVIARDVAGNRGVRRIRFKRCRIR
jgi:uncharacterized delta-60 repeat protein